MVIAIFKDFIRKRMFTQKVYPVSRFRLRRPNHCAIEQKEKPLYSIFLPHRMQTLLLFPM